MSELQKLDNAQRFVRLGMIPSALEYAARIYSKNPRKVGEILLALVAPCAKVKLDEAQQIIVGICLEQLDDRNLARERARRLGTERMRNYRERKNSVN